MGLTEEARQLNERGPNHTPWGPAQTKERIASGLYRVNTASHGGIWTGEQRMKRMPNVLRKVKTFSDLGDFGWWEEDIDWIWPVLAFSYLFASPDVARAYRLLGQQSTTKYPEQWKWLEESDHQSALICRRVLEQDGGSFK